ncbi:uncharacterized protein LTR77_002224 [Saxophila tyrrhenica]|uniref:Vanadium chloroperoxidase N-terminal domain-containing protein n=1 Tax=Saxophila tyrrhenica TaxID=1690608 RepID=A0AAV9PMK3_9PEZI|nr:hypothetical protein LTR77_002224 [Saxophila tyrrhenica]
MSLPVLPQVVEALPAGGGKRDYNSNYVFFWNNVALDLVRLTHTIGGPQGGPPLTARFLGILHLAVHDAYFTVFPYDDHPAKKAEFISKFEPYLDAGVRPASPTSSAAELAAHAKTAVAGAAITVLQKLFKAPDKRDPGVSLQAAGALSDFVDTTARSYLQANGINLRSAAYIFGTQIADVILAQLETKAAEPGVDSGNYTPNANAPYYFDDDPSHPIRLRPVDPNDPGRGDKVTRPYHGPRYGTTAAVFATTQDIKIADPPVVPSKPPTMTDPRSAPAGNDLEYLHAVEDVHRMGGVEEIATTKRRPAETARGLFWAYDGANLIGTPPRLYNQIVKQIAYDMQDTSGGLNSDENNAQFIRLLALVNVAMADAGVFCWRDKYKYELWRPLSGVRADPTGPVPDGHGRPTWRVLGAPATNSNEGGFKPPFPAYPSGHATFAAAAFQMARLFYDQRGDKKLKPRNVEGPGAEQDAKRASQDFVKVENGSQSPIQRPDPEPKDPRNDANDDIKFKFVSDELNGISRTLYQPYKPATAIEDQPGEVRTLHPIEFKSLKDAIFSNGMSRIWLGVHWNFDAFAGETVFVDYDEAGAANEGIDNNQPRPEKYKQQYQVHPDGSSKYKQVAEMDWFAAQGPREGCDGEHPVGGVPLGMMIANNIFDSRMRSEGRLENLADDGDERT